MQFSFLLIAVACTLCTGSLPTTWNQTTIPGYSDYYNFFSVDNTFVYLDKQNGVYTSSNGSYWVSNNVTATLVYASPIEKDIVASVKVQDQQSYVCYGPVGNLVQTCVEVPFGDETSYPYSVAYGDETFFVAYWGRLRNNGSIVSIKPKESSWTLATYLYPYVVNAGNGFYIHYIVGSVKYLNKQFYIATGAGVSQSADGQNWKPIATPEFFTRIIVANETLYGIGLNTSRWYFFNPESSQWTVAINDTVRASISYNGEIYFTCSENGVFYYSTDGQKFFKGGTVVSGFSCWSVAYANGYYVVLGKYENLNPLKMYVSRG